MTNRIIDKKFGAIVESVSYWLGYQEKIGRAMLIHEASLRYPIADTLTAKGIAIDRIALEQLHPIFKSKKIDLVVFDEEVREPKTEQDDSNLIDVYEFKLTNEKTGKKESVEHQRVFNDIARLGYYNLWRRKNCYFLMCGKYDEFKAFFVGQKNNISTQNSRNIVNQKRIDSGITSSPNWEASGIYEDWFSFEIGQPKTIEFSKDTSVSSPTNKWGLNTFQNDYRIRNTSDYQFSDTIKIKTVCMAISTPGETSRTHAVGIWQIEAVL